MRAATFFDGGRWHEGVVELVDGRVRLREGAPSVGLPRLDGVITGGFTDHHVHLQLVDHTLLSTSRLGRVVDLGGNPETLRELAAHNSGTRGQKPVTDTRSGHFRPGFPELGTASLPHRTDIRFAGAFLTPVGGYPSDREWAPAGSVCQVADAHAAAHAIDEMVDAGATCLKVTSNRTAGPVFSEELFRTIVGLAADRGLEVVAHAEGAGQAQRVATLGAALLAHAPFTERLDDDEIARQAASVSWISTLAIHDDLARAVATDNTRRFHAAGGTVLYGTDMGNGPMPVDLSPQEVAALREAGLGDTALLHALDPLSPREDSALLFLPGSSSVSADPLSARPLIPDDLKV